MTEPDVVVHNNAPPVEEAPADDGALPLLSAKRPDLLDWLVEAWSSAGAIKVSLAIFSLFVLLIAVLLTVKAFHSTKPADADTALDFLAYVLPCFAGLAGGYAIYEKDIERPLFALSFQLLTVGVVVYSTAHVPGGQLMGALLCAFLIVPLVLLIIEARNAQWNGRRLVKAVVWTVIGILVLISLIYLWRAFEVGSR